MTKWKDTKSIFKKNRIASEHEDKHTEKKIIAILPFRITSKAIKYIIINLTKIV